VARQTSFAWSGKGLRLESVASSHRAPELRQSQWARWGEGALPLVPRCKCRLRPPLTGPCGFIVAESAARRCSARNISRCACAGEQCDVGGTTATNSQDCGPAGDSSNAFFLQEALRWMEEAGKETESKLYCPNSSCHARVGQLNWVGVQIPKGPWVAPAIIIHKKAVDPRIIGGVPPAPATAVTPPSRAPAASEGERIPASSEDASGPDTAASAAAPSG
jgi:hypothetical protein